MNIHEQYEAAFVADPTLRPTRDIMLLGRWSDQFGERWCWGVFRERITDPDALAHCRAAVFTRLADAGWCVQRSGGAFSYGPVYSDDDWDDAPDLDTALLAALNAARTASEGRHG